MIKIYFSNWRDTNDCADFVFLDKLKNQTPDKSGVWKGIVGVEKIEDADYIVFFERINKKTDKPKVLLKKEPDYWKKKIQKADSLCDIGYSYPYAHIPAGIWWVDVPFNDLKKMEYHNKNKTLSIVSSGKNNLPGHKFRINILEEYSQRRPYSIDIYGKGIKKYINSISYKGSPCPGSMTSVSDKYDFMADYKYYLSIENGQMKDYFTEKISDALLSWCMPIYWGCPNILDYFPRDSLHILSDKKDIVRQIDKIINSPIKDKNIEAISKARELVLYRYNVWDIVNNIIKEKKHIR
jgi:hypothetical protein